MPPPLAPARVRLPQAPLHPIRILGQRLAGAIGLVGFVALVAYLGRDGYRDAAGGEVGALDALYYATVSVTTTGYGDITPVTDTTRALTAILVTPARVLFLILLVGTTLEILTQHTREAVRTWRWRVRLSDHTIVCGYGTKGRAAIESLLGQGVAPERVVVIDPSDRAVADANAAGLAAVGGNAARTSVLEEAGIREAVAVVVAPDRDDASVLITLTARELNPRATIVAAVREEENAHLLEQGGADAVITSSGAAGRLLGLATRTPRLVHVLEDLLAAGRGMEIVERLVRRDEVGPATAFRPDRLLVAVVRGERLLRFDEAEAAELRPGDRVVYICARPD